MINMPLTQIKEKISKKTELSQEDVEQKIKAKLKQLSGLISEEGAAHIVANEMGVKLFEVGEQLKIKNILSGMRNIDLIGKVVQTYELREFKTEKHEGKVANMLIGDETGVIRVVMWHKQADNINKLKKDDVVKIKSGYVKENNGRSEVHLNENSKLVINPEGVDVEVRSLNPDQAERKNIANISEQDAMVEVLATVVQVFDINFFEVCPECKKRIRMRDDGFVCPGHGKQEPDYNYVLNLYLDDGTDNIRGVFWREQVNQLLDMDASRVLTFKDDPSKFEPVKTELLGNIIKVVGRPNKNQNFDRVELVARTVDKSPNPDQEIQKLKQEADKALSEDQGPNSSASESQTEDKNTQNTNESAQAASESQAKETQARESKNDSGQAAESPEKKVSDNDDLENIDLDKELEDIA